MKILPSLKQIEYLIALDAEQHFGRAADACNVTPSTLSAGIRELESVLGIALAERTKRSVLMTPLGRQIAERGLRLLQDAEEIMALATATRKDPLTGDLHLGVIPTIGPFLLPRVLPGVWRDYPDLRLYLHEEQTDDLLIKLRRGNIDVAVIALPYDLGDLEARVLFDDFFQFACSKAHPLASRERIDATDLEDANLLLLQEGHCLRGHALDACGLKGSDHQGQFAATSFYTLVQMVAANLGCTLLPQLAIEGGITQVAPLSLIPLARPASRQIGLAWRRSTYHSREFELLSQELVPYRG
jgi:LysR family hydrogen peroxide-inducible transcriptional activator